MIDLTYRIIHFPVQDQYIGVAWNYESSPPVLTSTVARSNYTAARKELEQIVSDLNQSEPAQLRYFDGEYQCGADGILYPRETIRAN